MSTSPARTKWVSGIAAMAAPPQAVRCGTDGSAAPAPGVFGLRCPAQGFSRDSDPFPVNARVSARLRRGLLVAGVAVAVALAIPAVSGAQARRSSKTVEVSERDFHITVPKRLPAGDVV